MMTKELNQLEIHSFSPDQDIPRILSLRTSVEAVDQEGIEINEVTLRAQLNLPGHDPRLDRWVIEAPDEPSALVASALVRSSPGTDTADANILVRPDWRRLGVGSALLSRVIDRAHQLRAGSIQVYANARHIAVPGFLQKHGFTALGAYTELRLTNDVSLPPVIWPYGYTMRPYAEVQDLSILTEAMNLSYIPLWGHQEVTEDEMASWLPEFNPQGLILVFSEKGRVIGISRTEPSPERSLKNGKPTGYIDAPGVVPQHRRLDLYRALVLTGIRWLRAQGQALIEMESWGDKLEVLKMYRELGFKDMRQMVCYELKLHSKDSPESSVSP
jgi:mycothiol synthase